MRFDRRIWTICVVPYGLLAGFVAATAGCGGGGGGPSADSLLVSDSTVYQALSKVASDSLLLPSSCAGDTQVNCLDSVPGPAARLATEFVGDSVWSTGGESYQFFLVLKVHTISDVPITLLGLSCGLTVDSRLGTEAGITIYGSALFKAHGADSLVDELDLTGTSLVGLESADAAITGTPTCTALSSSIGAIVALLGSSLLPAQRYCAAPGTKLFQACPPEAARPRAVRPPHPSGS